jgi:mannose-6-phosphate isomerase-like protein (cupin superfamily)
LRGFFFIIHFFFSTILLAQESSLVHKAKMLKPNRDFDNVWSEKLYSDSLSSVFCIWIKKEVKMHKHQFHTEQVYVLEGKAKMILGTTEFEIAIGDIISIPLKTPHKVIVMEGELLKVLSIQSPQFDGSDRLILE